MEAETSNITYAERRFDRGIADIKNKIVKQRKWQKNVIKGIKKSKIKLSNLHNDIDRSKHLLSETDYKIAAIETLHREKTRSFKVNMEALNGLKQDIESKNDEVQKKIERLNEACLQWKFANQLCGDVCTTSRNFSYDAYRRWLMIQPVLQVSLGLDSRISNSIYASAQLEGYTEELLAHFEVKEVFQKFGEENYKSYQNLETKSPKQLSDERQQRSQSFDQMHIGMMRKLNRLLNSCETLQQDIFNREELRIKLNTHAMELSNSVEEDCLFATKSCETEATKSLGRTMQEMQIALEKHQHDLEQQEHIRQIRTRELESRVKLGSRRNQSGGSSRKGTSQKNRRKYVKDANNLNNNDINEIKENDDKLFDKDHLKSEILEVSRETLPLLNTRRRIVTPGTTVDSPTVLKTTKDEDISEKKDISRKMSKTTPIVVLDENQADEKQSTEIPEFRPAQPTPPRESIHNSGARRYTRRISTAESKKSEESSEAKSELKTENEKHEEYVGFDENTSLEQKPKLGEVGFESLEIPTEDPYKNYKDQVKWFVSRFHQPKHSRTYRWLKNGPADILAAVLEIYPLYKPPPTVKDNKNDKDLSELKIRTWSETGEKSGISAVESFFMPENQFFKETENNTENEKHEITTNIPFPEKNEDILDLVDKEEKIPFTSRKIQEIQSNIPRVYTSTTEIISLNGIAGKHGVKSLQRTCAQISLNTMSEMSNILHAASEKARKPTKSEIPEFRHSELSSQKISSLPDRIADTGIPEIDMKNFSQNSTLSNGKLDSEITEFQAEGSPGKPQFLPRTEMVEVEGSNEDTVGNEGDKLIEPGLNTESSLSLASGVKDRLSFKKSRESKRTKSLDISSPSMSTTIEENSTLQAPVTTFSLALEQLEVAQIANQIHSKASNQFRKAKNVLEYWLTLSIGSNYKKSSMALHQLVHALQAYEILKSGGKGKDDKTGEDSTSEDSPNKLKSNLKSLEWSPSSNKKRTQSLPPQTLSADVSKIPEFTMRRSVIQLNNSNIFEERLIKLKFPDLNKDLNKSPRVRSTDSMDSLDFPTGTRDSFNSINDGKKYSFDELVAREVQEHQDEEEEMSKSYNYSKKPNNDGFESLGSLSGGGGGYSLRNVLDLSKKLITNIQENISKDAGLTESEIMKLTSIAPSALFPNSASGNGVISNFRDFFEEANECSPEHYAFHRPYTTQSHKSSSGDEFSSRGTTSMPGSRGGVRSGPAKTAFPTNEETLVSSMETIISGELHVAEFTWMPRTSLLHLSARSYFNKSAFRKYKIDINASIISSVTGSPQELSLHLLFTDSDRLCQNLVSCLKIEIIDSRYYQEVSKCVTKGKIGNTSHLDIEKIIKPNTHRSVGEVNKMTFLSNNPIDLTNNEREFDHLMQVLTLRTRQGELLAYSFPVLVKIQ